MTSAAPDTPGPDSVAGFFAALHERELDRLRQPGRAAAAHLRAYDRAARRRNV